MGGKMKAPLKYVAAAAACALVACASFAAQAADTVKLGAVLSLTGAAGTLGDPALKTLQMYVDQTNKAGGLLGKQIELVTYDDGSEPAKANSFTKRLLDDDHVDMLIGGSTTGSTMAMYPLVDKAQIPYISLGGALVIVEPVKKWMFKVSHNDRMISEKVLMDMQKRGLKTVAMLTDTGGYGQSGLKETTALAPKFGVEVVAAETYGFKDTDMTAQLAKIKDNGKAQAIFVFGFGQGTVIAAKNIAQIGLTIPQYQAAGAASQEFLDLSGKASDGVRLPSPAVLVGEQLADNDPQKAISLEYTKSYKDRYKSDASTFGAYARDAFFIWANAVKRAGALDKAKVRDAIEQTKGFPGTCGVVNMTPEDHRGEGRQVDAAALRRDRPSIRNRHCEHSEAILPRHSEMDCFVASLRRNRQGRFLPSSQRQGEFYAFITRRPMLALAPRSTACSIGAHPSAMIRTTAVPLAASPLNLKSPNASVFARATTLSSVTSSTVAPSRQSRTPCLSISIEPATKIASTRARPL
jgi:branched-chain amino acid transport system substrate-binding protein